jgi:MoaA/NifB/PqqE/SkfB family radical SAM enzyme
MHYKSIVQVEVTTACQASCTFCPRTALKANWLSKNIAWEHFVPVLAGLNKGTLVHLQGWGEPLLHPRLWDMAAAVRQRKGKVSLTTNAMLLDESARREIMRIGLEFVCVSLADADCAGNASLRRDTDLNCISDNIEHLCSLKNRPRVHIAVQMMKPNIERLPGMVELAARLGADRVIASNIDCVTSREVEALKVFEDYTDPQRAEIIKAAKRRGRELKIEVEAFPLRVGNELPVCSANPLNIKVITVNGEVAPCTYLALPVPEYVPRIFRGQMYSIARFVYGTVADGIENIMRNEPANSFMALYRRRLRAAAFSYSSNLARLARPLMRSMAAESSSEDSRIISPLDSQSLPPAPDHCRYCYKLYGI